MLLKQTYRTSIMSVSKHHVADFDVLTTPLQGKNLIEASAGTGKTYSIAILTIRLILEERIPVTKILMVTFTQAAVAELAKRIRQFINYTKQHLDGTHIEDATLKKIIAQAQSIHGTETVKQLINDTYLLLDEMNIQTIHSFCQQNLNEFALETRQLFGAELIKDYSEIIERHYNVFWRKYITTLPVSTLNNIKLDSFRAQSLDIIKGYFDGKYLVNSISKQDTEEYYQLLLQPEALASILERQKMELQSIFSAYISEHLDMIVNKVQEEKISPHTLIIKNLHTSMTAFWSFIATRKQTEVIHILGSILPERFEQQLSVYLNISDENFTLSTLYNYGLHYVLERIHTFQKKSNHLTYNDLIQYLHKAVTNPDSQHLIGALRDKYHAVFVDEFQDTDKEQFDIFKTVFEQDSIMFLIGDPKQSIYTFRKADIFTYFRARNFVDHYYTMSTNFRSSSDFIHSMNAFFQPTSGFDTFYFNSEAEDIQYIPVSAPKDDTKGSFTYKGKALAGIQTSDHYSNQFSSMATDIYHLVNNSDYAITQNSRHSKVAYQDIGVLVRSKKEALETKSALQALGIPCIIQNESKLFEAKIISDISRLLEAILQPDISNIRTVVASPLMNYSYQDMIRLDEMSILKIFRQLFNSWKDKGISACLIQALDVLHIKSTLLQNRSSDYAIVTQLIEVLHSVAYYKALSPDELLLWLKNGIAGNTPDEDAYLLRLESDESAVQISTIHASKGLEYPIVFLPSLCLHDKYMPQIDTHSYRGADSNYYLNVNKLLTENEKRLINHQTAQENRRLIYVAITRAKYHCYIYQYKSKAHALTPFFEALTSSPSPYVLMNEVCMVAPPQDIIPIETNKESPNQQTVQNVPAIEAQDDNWTLLSYSKIAAHGDILKYKRVLTFDNDYEKFVFQLLRGGTETGNMLHNILERIDFKNPKSWKHTIKRSRFQHFSSQSEEEHLTMISKMVEHITRAPIHFPDTVLQLSDLSLQNRINEMEFYFQLQHASLSEVESLLKKDYEIGIKTWNRQYIQGMMNGFIDMVFRHNNKYYILDWKSNYLGYLPEDYNSESVKTAMDYNNYHLQYLIYTVALIKYLKTRMSDFDYQQDFGGIIYVFLRGVRNGSSNGIYTHKPEEKNINALMQLFS